MVEIISRRDGPRREDVAIRNFLTENRATITQLQQCLTGGQAPRRPTLTTPSAEVVRTFGYRRPEGGGETAPYLRFSPNGRVVIADFDTGRQMHHLGDLRGSGSSGRFVLALRENGYFAPLDGEIATRFADLDGLAVPDEDVRTTLAAEIAKRLGLHP